jgi:ribosomal protein S18 acetylase RimI-like enzyme
MAEHRVVVRPFVAADQEAARGLLLDGLGQHFGFIDETLNPDLDDITAHYLATNQTFLVAVVGGMLVGTGALINEAAAGTQTGRVVRMSVAREMRRMGIGQAVLARLIEIARERGFTRLVLETNIGWDDAIGFYQRCGFCEYAQGDGLTHMLLDLA